MGRPTGRKGDKPTLVLIASGDSYTTSSAEEKRTTLILKTLFRVTHCWRTHLQDEYKNNEKMYTKRERYARN